MSTSRRSLAGMLLAGASSCSSASRRRRAARVRTIRPELAVVNGGCPGESTRTFIEGPCRYPALGGALHDPYGGSQLSPSASLATARIGG